MADLFVITVLFGFLGIGIALQLIFRGLPGVLATIIFGWLFLPPGRGINLPGLPMYTKEYAVSYAALLGVVCLDAARITSFRPKLLDLPAIIWILSPIPSSVTNGLGYYDGFASAYSQFFIFGVPYFLGRIYIRTPDDVRTVAKWIVIAGVIAVPLVIWESRMSPNLNRTVYGYDVAKFHMAKRLGGYRPMLFMRHGLEVGLWMATSAAVALWMLIASRDSIKVYGQKSTVITPIILIATVLCRSLGSLILLGGTALSAFFVRATGLRIALVALVLAPSTYLSVRITGIWSPDQLTSIIAGFNPDRADSLESRLQQETVISEHALEKPLFGWGGHDRYRPIDDDGDTSPVDGWTSITLGKYGLVGLISLMCFTALPSILILSRVRGRELVGSHWAPTTAIMLGTAIFSLDILFNAFPTPLHMISIGVLGSCAIHARKWRRAIVAFQASQSQSQPALEPA